MSNKKKSPRKVYNIRIAPVGNGYTVEVESKRGDDWSTDRSRTSVFSTSAEVAEFVEETLDGE